MDSDEILLALDTDFEDSGSEYNPESDFSFEDDDHDENDDGGNTTSVQLHVIPQWTWFDVTGNLNIDQEIVHKYCIKNILLYW